MSERTFLTATDITRAALELELRWLYNELNDVQRQRFRHIFGVGAPEDIKSEAKLKRAYDLVVRTLKIAELNK